MSNINTIDTTMGEASFTAVKPTLAAIPQGQIMRVGIDLHAAAIVAINAGSVAERPEIRARFLSLPESVFDHAQLAELTRLGYAVWYARTEANGFEAKSSGTQAIAQLMARASEVRERMFRVIGHCFAEDQTVSGGLAIVRRTRDS
jgi:hypothetical protein